MITLQLVEGIANLIVSTIIFTVGLFVYLKGKEQKINKMFFVFCIPVSVWLFLYGLAFLSQGQNVIEFLFKSGYIAIVFIPILTFNFALVFLNKEKKILKFLLYFGYFCAFTFSFLINFTPYIINGLFRYPWGYYPKASLPAHLIFILYFNLYYTIAVMLLFFGFCRKIDISPIEKARRKFVFFAWMIGTFGAMDFIPNYGYAYGINILPLGSIFMIPTYSMIGYAVVKYRLMDIRVFVTRATAFLISYPFLLCVPFIFGYRMRPILSPSLGIHWWFVPIGLMAFFATVSPLAYGQLRKKMEEVFLADQKRYQKLLLQAAAGMIRERNLNHLAKLIVYIIKRVIKIEFAAIFLNDQQNKTYSLKAIRNSNLVNLDAKFSYDDPLINYLKEHQEPVLYEELPFKIRASLKLPLTIDVIIPSIIETNLLGFVVLGEKLNHQPYSEDDINVFRTLSRQAALAISYCSFLEVFKNAQEKIFTADKLATVGGMAEGVAHQIKNRLNEFSMAAGEIDVNINDIIDKYPELMQTHPDLKKILEDSLGAIKSIFANVIHTDGIIRGILSYGNLSQDEKAKLIGEFPLKPVIDNVVELVETKHEVTNFPLILDLGPDDTIYGVKIQIHECILNILDNAYEACDERRKFRLSEQEKQNYKPFINLKLTQNEEYTFITVSDNGAGIKEQDKPKIFSPFFTTKSSYISGTGIGMYIVKRLVEENHNGKISFESEYMKGTTFYIKLPRKVKQ